MSPSDFCLLSLEESLRNALEALGGLSESAYADTTTAAESPSAGTKVRDALYALVLARPGGKKAAKEVMTPLRHALTGQKVRPLCPLASSDGNRESSLTSVRGAIAGRRERAGRCLRPRKGGNAPTPQRGHLMVRGESEQQRRVKRF